MSELYASVLMVAVTITLGSAVAVAATDQFSLSGAAAASSAAVERASSGVELGLAYAVVTPSGGCPSQGGVEEGQVLTMALYNYGPGQFAPVEIVVNSSIHSQAFAPLGAGSLGAYDVALGTCAHSSGQTILVVDGSGAVVEFES